MLPPDRGVLAGRIQGFGNVNPPPLEEETGSSVAKRAVSRLGDMVGEEVMLTVEDFREKGAVGAVKDAVADAGDILIDGVSGLIGWIRGDPPTEEENEKAEDATKALSNGPAGAAYGISQASPTGGINAVWVMPEEADPQALASLVAQQGGLVPQSADPRVPKNIQPYQPPPSSGSRGMPPLPMASHIQVPGGPVIAPYQPAPSGPGGFKPLPFVPSGAGVAPSLAQGRWGPGGYSPASTGSSGSASSGPTGAKGLVERIAKGEVLVGPDVAKRLVSQCTAAKTTPKQLGEIVCERARRLYLGLDGGDPAESDAALLRLLGLVDELNKLGSELSKGAVQEVNKGVSEELLSLRSSAKHRDEATPMLRRLGLIAGGQATASSVPDLLGGSGGSTAAVSSRPVETTDLLGGLNSAVAPAAKEADLLGSEDSSSPAPAVAAKATDAPPCTADLLGGTASSSATTGIAALDPLSSGLVTASSGSSLLGSLTSLDVPASVLSGPAGSLGMPAGVGGSAGAPQGAMSSMAALAFPGLGKEQKKDEDAFGFVGAEMNKAKKSP